MPLLHTRDYALLEELFQRWYDLPARWPIRVSFEKAAPGSGRYYHWRSFGDGSAEIVFAPFVHHSYVERHYIARWFRSLPLLIGIALRNPGMEGQVVVNLGDWGTIPGLAFCANRPGFDLIPDHEFINSRGHIEFKRQIGAAALSWESRRPIAFWRGATYGRATDVWRTLPRARLCALSLPGGIPDLIDAGLTGFGGNVTDADREEIRMAGLLRPAIRPEEMAGWRYQVDIDGASNSWSGLFRKLCTGSTVLKVTSPDGYKQWYYERLVSWTNFVPIESDLSDLQEKIRWLIAHDDVARKIGDAGRRLANSITYESELAAVEPTVVQAFRRSQKPYAI